MIRGLESRDLGVLLGGSRALGGRPGNLLGFKVYALLALKLESLCTASCNDGFVITPPPSAGVPGRSIPKQSFKKLGVVTKTRGLTSLRIGVRVGAGVRARIERVMANQANHRFAFKKLTKHPKSQSFLWPGELCYFHQIYKN